MEQSRGVVFEAKEGAGFLLAENQVLLAPNEIESVDFGKICRLLVELLAKVVKQPLTRPETKRVATVFSLHRFFRMTDAVAAWKSQMRFSSLCELLKDEPRQ